MAIFDNRKGVSRATTDSCECARSIYVARKKVINGEVLAHCFRNGVKAFGNVFTTEQVNGQWVLNRLNAKPYAPPTFTSAVNTKLHERWTKSVIEITEQQAIFPWFECRTGCLTGTTTKNIFRCLKFVLTDDTIIGWDVVMFFKEIGIVLKRPSEEDLKKVGIVKRKKRFVALGYTCNATNSVINEALKLHYPHDSLVYEKLVKSWCMAPIKTRAKATKDSFAQGKAAEPLINGSIEAFFKTRTDEIVLQDLWNTGLFRRKQELLVASSHDGMAMMNVPAGHIRIGSLNDTVSQIQSFLRNEKHKLTVERGNRITAVVTFRI